MALTCSISARTCATHSASFAPTSTLRITNPARWLGHKAFYRLELMRFTHENASLPDNPDQRIQEDINQFTSLTIGLSMGLLNAVVPEEQLLDKAFEYAARIVKNAPLAIQATKRSVLEGLKLDLREAYRNEANISREVFATEDAKEGPRAFAEKRTPVFKGR